MNQQLLLSFFDFLGFKDEAFNGLPEELYDPKNNTGTKAIHDFLKKKMFRNEEKPATRRANSVKKKASVQKASLAKNEPKQIKDASPVVQVEAIGEVHGNDEKLMPFRKDMNAGSDIDAEDPSGDSLEGVTHTDQLVHSFGVEAQKKSLKELFTGLMDAAPNTIMKHIQFTWNAPDDCHFSTLADPT